MAINQILFRPRRGFTEFGYDVNNERIEGSDVFWELDGVIEENHSSDVLFTRHPIEYGASITDHAISQPVKVTVRGMVTNAPTIVQVGNNIPGIADQAPSLSRPRGFQGFQGLQQVGRSFQNALASVGSGFDGSRIGKAYLGLLEIQRRRQLMTLHTGFADYQNMVLRQIRGADTVENNLRVTLEFEEVIIADTQAEGGQSVYEPTPPSREVDVVSGLAMLTGLGIGAGSLIFS